MSSAEAQRRPATDETIYVIESDPSERQRLKSVLTSTFRHVKTFDSGESFLGQDESIRQGCLITAAALPGRDVLEFIDRLKSEGIRIPVIVLGDEMPLAVNVIRAGAADFIERPFTERRLREAVRQVLA